MPESGYEPEGRDWRILNAYTRLLDDGKDATHAQLATALKCSRQAVSKRFAKAGFREWLSAELESHLRAELGPILASFARAARRGSVLHFDRLARVLGWFGAEDSYSSAEGLRQPAQINILVPRP